MLENNNVENNQKFLPIIKNIGRFENIKLATGVILDNSPKKFRSEYSTSNFTGISTKKFGRYWFEVNGKNAIFKSFDEQPTTRSARVVNELLCMELCKQIGLECATCEPATLKGFNGIISYNVANNNEKILSSFELKNLTNCQDRKNTVYDFYHFLKVLKNRGTNINLNKEIENLYKLAIFDMLTMQTDRHSGNIFFLYNKKTNTLRLSPIFDNELSFLATHLTEMHLFYDYVDFDLTKEIYNDTPTVFSIKQIKNKTKKYDTLKQDIIDFANKSEKTKSILNEVLSNFDIKSAIKKVEKNGVKIPQSYKNYVTMITETVKHNLKDELDFTNNGTSYEA